MPSSGHAVQGVCVVHVDGLLWVVSARVGRRCCVAMNEHRWALICEIAAHFSFGVPT